MRPLIIEIDGIPPSTNNAYFDNGTRRALTGVARAFKERTAWAARVKAQQEGWRYESRNRISVCIDLYFRDNRRRDIANCEKLLIDALSAALGFDDCVIDDLHIRRRGFDKNNPRCIVKIEQFSETS